MKTKLNNFLIMGCCLLALNSCHRDRYSINISKIKAEIEIERLEDDLFKPDPAALTDSVPSLIVKYGDFLQYFSYIIKAGTISDSAFALNLLNFSTDKLNTEVYGVVSEKYPDLKFLEADLSEAFRHYKWYFPDENVPAVYTCITGFNNSIITADSVLGICLDRYLGSDSEYYARLGIYGYLAAQMNSWNIVPDCMYAWGKSIWDFEHMKYPAANVITQVLHEGKLLYFKKCMIPSVSDTLLFGFTGDQMKFCRNNESRMWLYMIEEDLLFSSDQFIIRKLTGEAPFTSYFSNESPGRAAVWIGFRIIESYMALNKNVSLGEMMEITDVQAILDGAKYRPQ